MCNVHGFYHSSICLFVHPLTGVYEPGAVYHAEQVLLQPELATRNSFINYFESAAQNHPCQANSYTDLPLSPHDYRVVTAESAQPRKSEQCHQTLFHLWVGPGNEIIFTLASKDGRGKLPICEYFSTNFQKQLFVKILTVKYKRYTVCFESKQTLLK